MFKIVASQRSSSEAERFTPFSVPIHMYKFKIMQILRNPKMLYVFSIDPKFNTRYNMPIGLEAFLFLVNVYCLLCP